MKRFEIMANGYKSMNLPATLVDELRVWQMAFNNAYGRTVSYGEMIRGMLDSLEDTEPGVVDELNQLVKKHPELMEKLGNYRGLASEKENNEG